MKVLFEAAVSRYVMLGQTLRYARVNAALSVASFTFLNLTSVAEIFHLFGLFLVDVELIAPMVISASVLVLIACLFGVRNIQINEHLQAEKAMLSLRRIWWLYSIGSITLFIAVTALVLFRMHDAAG